MKLVGEFCHVPLESAMLLPSAAKPLTTGATVLRGGTNSGATAKVEAVQICLFPEEFDARTEATMNLPTREDGRVYVAEVAPEIAEQPRGIEVDVLLDSEVH